MFFCAQDVRFDNQTGMVTVVTVGFQNIYTKVCTMFGQGFYSLRADIVQIPFTDEGKKKNIS